MAQVTGQVVEAQVRATGKWVSPCGRVSVTDQPRVFGGAWPQRYCLTVHKPWCENPVTYGCDCDQAKITLHIRLGDVCALAASSLRMLTVEEAA